VGARHERFRDLQRSFFQNADVEHFRWQTTNRFIAATERNLLDGFPLPSGGTVLEVGCGEGGNLVNLLSNGEPNTTLIVGLDLFEGKLAFAQREVTAARFVCGDAQALPFEDGAFDAVLCRDVLHHLERPAAALAELRRICRSGGDLWIVEPNGRNLLMILLAALRPHERGLLRNSMTSLRAVVADHFSSPSVLEARQPMPIYRLLLHHKFGLPRLGDRRSVASLMLGLERALRPILPRRWWAYILIKVKP
jgi:ubiquinone/menaquinone biosynthesis C-methylase UbiE